MCISISVIQKFTDSVLGSCVCVINVIVLITKLRLHQLTVRWIDRLPLNSSHGEVVTQCQAMLRHEGDVFTITSGVHPHDQSSETGAAVKAQVLRDTKEKAKQNPCSSAYNIAELVLLDMHHVCPTSVQWSIWDASSVTVATPLVLVTPGDWISS